MASSSATWAKAWDTRASASDAYAWHGQQDATSHLITSGALSSQLRLINSKETTLSDSYLHSEIVHHEATATFDSFSAEQKKRSAIKQIQQFLQKLPIFSARASNFITCAGGGFAGALTLLGAVDGFSAGTRAGTASKGKVARSTS